MPLPLNVESLVKQVGVKSAVNASLWSCAVISLPSLFISYETSGFKAVAFFAVALLPVLAFIFSYIYLLFKNPNHLRSEGYHLRADLLRTFGDKDNPLNATADDAVRLITNPQLPAPTPTQTDSLEQLANPETQ